MQIEINGQRNITLDFDAPKKFKLFKDGAEVPYIRTGKNSFRLGKGVDGVVELEEVIEKPKIVKPMQLQPQQMALVNPNDVIMINQAAQQLEIEQGLLAETQKQVSYTQEYLDIQQQRINEAVADVQNLETNNAERITSLEGGVFKLAGEIAGVENNANDGINSAIEDIEAHKRADNPHNITKKTIGLDKVDNTADMDKPVSKAVQKALDEKADKTEIDAIREEIGEYQEKNERINNALSTYTGGLASMSDHRELEGRDFPDQHPIGAITGLQNALDDKVNKTAEASKVYGTDESGQQTTYNLSQLGGVSDVRVDGESVVTDNVANLGSMALENASDYSTKDVADTLYAAISYEGTIDNHIADKNNPHEVTKAQVGLGNVDNTSDLNKPISTATQTALDGKVDKVSVANKVYGTDSDGTQTTYDVGSFGQVDDVQVGGVSVVTNKIAELGTMAGETASNYSTTAQADLRYATASQGALADTALQPNDNITELTNNAGYITGITSSDVTSALGYTPYNSSNPSGYQANVIETVKVNGTALTPTNKAVDITVPSAVTEATVSGWGFTKNIGTVTSVNNTQPDANGNVTISTGGNYTAGTGIDITNDVISVASPTLTNSSTFSSSVGIFSDFGQHGYSSVGIGYSSEADSSGTVALGYMARAVNSYATALGYQATAGGYCSIQLGYGSNNTRDKFNVGFFRGTDSQSHNWEMLDGTTGLIPDARISSNIARTSAIPTVDQTYDSTSTNAQSGTAVAEALAGFSGANTDLSNLTSTGKNLANWSSNVTNCITEIPQDIKVGLNNGGLYLKAGCKYCVPNGFEQDGVTPHFDFVTVNADSSSTAYGTGRTGCMVVWSTDHFEWSTLSNFYSGSTQPTDTWWIWYDTTTNKIKHYNGSTIVEGVSFPICMITENAGTGYDSTVKSIDHTFNGFGYIGSTVFALPGVKGLIPDGRNADGTLKNIEFTISNVLTEQLHDTVDVACYLHYNGQNTLELFTWTGFLNQYVYKLPNNPLTYGRYYNITDNLWYFYDGSNWYKGNSEQCCYLGKGFISSNKYNGIELRTPFHALDYNDSSTISGWSMPSSRYIDLTLGASGATYTAPANGYFCLDKAGTQNEYIDIRNNTTGLLRSKTTISAPGTESIAVYMPCKKGDEIAVVYTATGTTNRFRFIYAEGENV